MNNSLQEVIVKVSGVSLKFQLIKCKKFYVYSFHRNDRILLTGQAPLSHKPELKADVARMFLEQTHYEILNKIKKIEL